MTYKNLDSYLFQIRFNPGLGSEEERLEQKIRQLSLIINNEFSSRYLNDIPRLLYLVTKNPALCLLFNLIIWEELFNLNSNLTLRPKEFDLYMIFFKKLFVNKERLAFLNKKRFYYLTNKRYTKDTRLESLVSEIEYKFNYLYSVMNKTASDFDENFTFNYDQSSVLRIDGDVNLTIRQKYLSIFRWKQEDKQEIEKVNVLLDLVEEISSERYVFCYNPKKIEVACIPFHILEKINLEQKNRIVPLLAELPFWTTSFGYFWTLPQNKTLAEKLKQKLK